MVRMGPTMGPVMGPRMGPNAPYTLSIRIVAHGLPAGSGAFTLTTTGVLPAPLAAATDYYAIPVTADTLQLAASRADALAGTAITLTDRGSGTHTLVTNAGTFTSATATAPPVALTFSQAFVANDIDGWIVMAGHGLWFGDGPFRATTDGVLPASIPAATDLWFIDIDADTGNLALSYADAIAGTPTGVSDAGTGTHTLTATGAAEHYAPIALPDSTFTVA